MSNSCFAQLVNGRAVKLDVIPILAFDNFRQAILDGVAAGQRVSAMFGNSTIQSDAAQLYAVMADDE